MTCLTRPLLMRPQCEFLLGASADSLALLTGISPVWVVAEWWLPSVNRDVEHCNTLFLFYCRAAPAATASMRFLVRLAERLALLSAQQPLSQAQQQVLQDALHLMRDICARDDSGRGMCGGGNLVASLQAAGFLSTFLALLKALGPIQRPPHQQQAAAAAPPAAQDGSGIPVAELAPALAQQAKGFPADPPYQGWRTDLLAAVANAAHDRPSVKVGRRKAYAWRTPVSCLQLLHLKSPPSRRLALPRGVCAALLFSCSTGCPWVQAEVSALGGVELVLAQCQVDYQSPLAREWALWGVRNLCEGNVQAQVRQLCSKPAAVVDTLLWRVYIRLGNP
jgi:ataxin-10